MAYFLCSLNRWRRTVFSCFFFICTHRMSVSDLYFPIRTRFFFSSTPDGRRNCEKTSRGGYTIRTETLSSSLPCGIPRVRRRRLLSTSSSVLKTHARVIWYDDRVRRFPFLLFPRSTTTISRENYVRTR